MAELPAMSERHEVRVPGDGQTIVFVADSEDGRLIIRQERPGAEATEVCSIALTHPDELRGVFQGLRRIQASHGQENDSGETARELPSRSAGRAHAPQR